MKLSSIFSFTCIIGLVLSVVIFFGGFLANSAHPASVLYGSLVGFGFSLLLGGLYYYLSRRGE